MVALSHLFTYFNSRPHGGRLCCRKSTCFRLPFQLTPSRRATNGQYYIYARMRISTHALTEGDHHSGERIPDENISTHALTEGDDTVRDNLFHNNTFQLTPSRRATQICYFIGSLIQHFNSRPHGGRPCNSSIFDS